MAKAKTATTSKVTKSKTEKPASKDTTKKKEEIVVKAAAEPLTKHEPSKKARKRRDSNADLESYKTSALRAAKQLCYRQTIIDRIRKATSEQEVVRAMKAGRDSMRD